VVHMVDVVMERQGMANSRHKDARDRPTGRQPASKAKSPASKRTTAHGASRGRNHGLRGLFVPLAAVSVVLAVIAGLVVANLSSGGAAATPDQVGRAPTSVVSQVKTLTPSVLSRIGAGQAATALERVPAGSPLRIDGKPGVVFVSEESCPFCAAERWPVVIALSHFGTWSDLGATTSSSTDVYPSTATFSFRHANYSSRYLALRTTELTDNLGRPLQRLTQLDNGLLARYDVPPYVNSADQSGAVPFLDIDNHYILAGAQYDPQVLAGLSMSQIAAQLKDPASPVAQAIDESANVLIASIDQVLRDLPTRS
jgi:hypothetical protein